MKTLDRVTRLTVCGIEYLKSLKKPAEMHNENYTNFSVTLAVVVAEDTGATRNKIPSSTSSTNRFRVSTNV